MTPLCFVLMPFGQKPDSTGQTIDFDAVYSTLIEPSIRLAGLEPLRADEEITGGIIHKPMFERLILCEYAIADVTTANPNVFYELGIRHAVRPSTTVLLYSKQGRLPFDIAPLRAIPYTLGVDGKPAAIQVAQEAIARYLTDARKPHTDSPIYQLVEGFPDIQRLKTDVFREMVSYSARVKEQLAVARKQGEAAVIAVQESLGAIADEEAAIVIDLFLSYRSVKGWERMIALVPLMSPPLAATVMVQEQLALALNRAKRHDEAERVLLKLIAERGPSSETNGILGRIYKDKWEEAVKAGETFAAGGLIDKAIDAYLKGFESDWRDAYPGINAITLMELRAKPDPRRFDLIPVVRYATSRRIGQGKGDYWDYATLLELAVLAKEEETAVTALGSALAAIREKWEPETTARNLRLIRENREARGEIVPWAITLENELMKKA